MRSRVCVAGPGEGGATAGLTLRRLERLVLSPKRYVIDAGLAAAVLRLDVDLVMRSGDLLGRFLDTFLLSQLRAEFAVSASRPRLFHVRKQQGWFEVDLLAEIAGGGLIGIEVRADSAPNASSARHLAGLRDNGDTDRRRRAGEITKRPRAEVIGHDPPAIEAGHIRGFARTASLSFHTTSNGP